MCVFGSKQFLVMDNVDQFPASILNPLFSLSDDLGLPLLPQTLQIHPLPMTERHTPIPHEVVGLIDPTTGMAPVLLAPSCTREEMVVSPQPSHSDVLPSAPIKCDYLGSQTLVDAIVDLNERARRWMDTEGKKLGLVWSSAAGSEIDSKEEIKTKPKPKTQKLSAYVNQHAHNACYNHGTIVSAWCKSLRGYDHFDYKDQKPEDWYIQNVLGGHANVDPNYPRSPWGKGENNNFWRLLALLSPYLDSTSKETYAVPLAVWTAFAINTYFILAKRVAVYDPKDGKYSDGNQSAVLTFKEMDWSLSPVNVLENPIWYGRHLDNMLEAPMHVSLCEYIYLIVLDAVQRLKSVCSTAGRDLLALGQIDVMKHANSLRKNGQVSFSSNCHMMSMPLIGDNDDSIFKMANAALSDHFGHDASDASLPYVLRESVNVKWFRTRQNPNYPYNIIKWDAKSPTGDLTADFYLPIFMTRSNFNVYIPFVRMATTPVGDDLVILRRWCFDAARQLNAHINNTNQRTMDNWITRYFSRTSLQEFKLFAAVCTYPESAAGGVVGGVTPAWPLSYPIARRGAPRGKKRPTKTAATGVRTDSGVDDSEEFMDSEETKKLKKKQFTPLQSETMVFQPNMATVAARYNFAIDSVSQRLIHTPPVIECYYMSNRGSMIGANIPLSEDGLGSHTPNYVEWCIRHATTIFGKLGAELPPDAFRFKVHISSGGGDRHKLPLTYGPLNSKDEIGYFYVGRRVYIQPLPTHNRDELLRDMAMIAMWLREPHAPYIPGTSKVPPTPSEAIALQPYIIHMWRGLCCLMKNEVDIIASIAYELGLDKPGCGYMVSKMMMDSIYQYMLTISSRTNSVFQRIPTLKTFISEKCSSWDRKSVATMPKFSEILKKGNVHEYAAAIHENSFAYMNEEENTHEKLVGDEQTFVKELIEEVLATAHVPSWSGLIKDRPKLENAYVIDLRYDDGRTVRLRTFLNEMRVASHTMFFMTTFMCLSSYLPCPRIKYTNRRVGGGAFYDWPDREKLGSHKAHIKINLLTDYFTRTMTVHSGGITNWLRNGCDITPESQITLQALVALASLPVGQSTLSANIQKRRQDIVDASRDAKILIHMDKNVVSEYHTPALGKFKDLLLSYCDRIRGHFIPLELAIPAIAQFIYNEIFGVMRDDAWHFSLAIPDQRVLVVFRDIWFMGDDYRNIIDSIIDVIVEKQPSLALFHSLVIKSRDIEWKDELARRMARSNTDSKRSIAIVDVVAAIADTTTTSAKTVDVLLLKRKYDRIVAPKEDDSERLSKKAAISEESNLLNVFAEETIAPPPPPVVSLSSSPAPAPPPPTPIKKKKTGLNVTF